MFSIKTKGYDKTIHWWPSSGPNSFVPSTWNKVYKIMVSDYEFLDIIIETRLSNRTYYVSAVVVRRQDNKSVNVDFQITHEFLRDLGVDCSKPFDDLFVESLVYAIDRGMGWDSMYSKHAKTQNQMKSYTRKTYFESFQNPGYHADYNDHVIGEINTDAIVKEHVQKEKERNELIIKELRDQIVELKEELEMLKAINQEC